MEHGTCESCGAAITFQRLMARPVATHNRRIHDYASWRGMLVMTGLETGTSKADPRVIRSEDGRAALWLGSVDELWGLGKPVGVGGPWKDTAVAAGEAFLDLQHYALALRRRGILLAVCSKNDAATAVEPFDRHPEMALKRSPRPLSIVNSCTGRPSGNWP